MSDTKAVTFTIKERLEMLKMFNQFKGNIEVMAVILEDVKSFPISPEEWAAANLKKTPSDEDAAKLDPEVRARTAQTWTWDEEGREKEITLHQESIDFVLGKIKEKSDAGDIALEDASLIAIQKKLK